MPRKIDLTGQVFGRLTVIREIKKRKNNCIVWLCKCECGKTKYVRSGSLASSKTRSCGCYKRERASETHRIHGQSGRNRTRLYKVWGNMIRRCSDKTCKDYRGRGISVCTAWQDFTVFRDWALSRGFREDLQIDRIDNDGNYCPENCRWSTHKDNQRNTRRTRWETMNGETKSLAEWCEIYNTPYSTVHQRLTLGWDLIDALAKPVKKNCRNKKSNTEVKNG